jgi:putative ABC transport system ATP-binding protein
MATPLIQIDSLVKQYTRDAQVLTVLDKLSLSVDDGDFVALMGPSGSGKTTLLNLIAGIDRPTSGRILVGDAEVSKMSEAALAKWRSANVGFIFQLYNLVPVLTAFENVELPLLLTNLNRARRRRQVELALSVVGLADRMEHYPRQLSGGQEQRVAIARAIATDPKLLVADEPTGDLDAKSGEEILTLMERLNDEFKKTIVMVTHDPKAAGRAHRLVHLDKGVLKEDVHAEKGKAVGMAAAISASAT